MIKIGDKVICTVSGVKGTVIKIYKPTACEYQIMVETSDYRKYHAPYNTWVKVG